MFQELKLLVCPKVPERNLWNIHHLIFSFVNITWLSKSSFFSEAQPSSIVWQDFSQIFKKYFLIAVFI